MEMRAPSANLRTETANTTPPYPIRLEGTVRPYVCNIAEDQLIRFSGPDCHVQVFCLAWMDKHRGELAHVAFPSGGGAGNFALGMDLHEHDSRHLKVQVSMRIRDEETNNVRTITLAVSASDLTTLLQGQSDSFRMYDQFTDGNYVDITLRIKNATDYANHPQSLAGSPLITLGPSALDNIGALNASMAQVSAHVNANLATNSVCIPAGAMPFKKGMTRSVPPLPFPLFFFSLCVGTPAYSLL